MNLYEFMSKSPFLTFFIFFIVGCTVHGVFKYVAIMFRGYPEHEEDCDEE